MNYSASYIEQLLKQQINPEKALLYKRFHKTNPGGYGADFIFLGIPMPILRQQIKLFKNVPIKEIAQLLYSPYHEVKLFSLLLLLSQYKASTPNKKYLFVDFYLQNTNFINSWDLVDLTAPHLIGDYLFNKEQKLLFSLVKSNNMWERRIAIVATLNYIRKNIFTNTLQLSEILLLDNEDIIHKAVGWMLREVGKRSRITEESFLNKNYKKMPRTMLRYAIELFEIEKKQFYMS